MNVMRNTMKNLKVSIVTFSLSLFFVIGRTQTVETVEKMAVKHQSCLDAGVDMLGCSKRFYFQMDSLLNVVYTNLISTLETTDKATLKNQQIAWLKKRNTYCKKQEKEFRYKYKKGEWGKDMEMISYDEKAIFIKRRIIDLIKRSNK